MNDTKAYWRMDAEQKIRHESMNFAVRVLKIMPSHYKKPISVLDFARMVEGFITDRLKEDIDELPRDVIEGLRKKYGDKESYKDLL